MNANFRQYLFGAIFFAIGIYFLVAEDNGLEASLYIMAGICFAANTLTNEPRLAPYKKTMVIVTWVLIISTSILFLWVMQSKYF